MHPAERVLGPAVLHVDQGLADPVRQLDRGRRRGGAAGLVQGADGGDHGGGAAGEHLGDPTRGHALAPLLDREAALLDGVAEGAEQLDDLRDVVVVFAVLCAGLWVEEVVASDELEGL